MAYPVQSMRSGGGEVLLYLQMHDNPDDTAAVPRDYGNEMIPAGTRDLHPRADDRRRDVQRIRRQPRAQEERRARRPGHGRLGRGRSRVATRARMHRGRKPFQPKLNSDATRD